MSEKNEDVLLKATFEEMWDNINNTLKRMGRLDRVFDLNTESTALIVVDMQNAFCSPEGALENPDARNIVENLNTLVKACRGHDIPIIWTKQEFNPDQSNVGLLSHLHTTSPVSSERKRPLEELSKGTWGVQLWKGLNFDPNKDYVISKCRYSAFTPGSSDLDGLLRTLKKDTLIITGVTTNVCCESTARDAMMYDYKVLFVSDATATTNEIFHQVALMNMKIFFADVVDTEALLKDLYESESGV